MAATKTARPASAAPNAAGPPANGSAAAASARPGARSTSRRARAYRRARRPARSPLAAVPISQVTIECRALARRPGIGELDRVLGGGIVPGRRAPARRRAGRRQVDAAARGRRPLRPSAVAARSTSRARSPRPRCGCGPSAPGRSTTTSTSPPRPTSPPCSATSRRSSPTCWSRLGPDDRLSADIDGVAGGVTQVRAVAAALVRRRQGRDIADAARRPRHQGRLDRRAARARAPRRRRAAVRGRAQLRAPPAARRQEPLRPGRRDRLLRPRRRRHRRGRRSDRTVHLPSRRTPCPAPASPSRSRAAARCWPRCRRWSSSLAARPRAAHVSGLDSSRLAMLLAVLERARAG